MRARLLSAPLTAFVAVGLLAAGLAPAHAAEGRVTSASAPLYRNCFSHPFRYTVTDAGTRWTLRARLVAPGGRVVSTANVPASAGASGRGAFRLCAGTMSAGTFQVRSQLTWSTPAGQRTRQLPHDSLRLRLPRTKTDITVKPRKTRVRKRVRVKVRVKEERPYGYFTQPGSRVRLYVRHHGAWRRTGAVRRTNASGTTTFKVRWRWQGKHRVRAVTLRDKWHAKSTSHAVTVKARKVTKKTKGAGRG